MKKMIRICLAMISLTFLVLAGCPVSADISILQEYKEQQKEEMERYREMLFDGKISQDAYLNAERLTLYRYQYQILNTPAAAKEYLDAKGMLNVEGNTSRAKAVLDSVDMRSYYAESIGIEDNEVPSNVAFSFSKSIPLSEDNMLLTIGNGYLTEENLNQYVSAWIFIGYADGEPFGVFQVSGPKGEYHVSGIVPDVQTAVAYDSLLNIDGCYTISPMISLKIGYLVVKDGVVQSVHQRDVATLETKDIATTPKESEFYYYARRISSIRSLEVSIENEEAVLLGGKATESSYTFEDAKRQAYYELYIRPYLMPAVAVLALGAVVIIVVIVRKRKQKKA